MSGKPLAAFSISQSKSITLAAERKYFPQLGELTMKPGPKPLPSNVHVLHGNPSKKATSSLLMDSLQPEISLPGCPSHLLPEAKKEYKRITPELIRYGLLSKIDRAALCLYLQTWAELVYAESMIQRQMKLADKKRAEAEARGEEYEGGDGMVDITKNGNVIYSPYWVIANRARSNVARFLESFGMSPASRTRVTPSNYLQQGLFDTPEGQAQGNGFNDL